jgi:hypothetical protein
LPPSRSRSRFSPWRRNASNAGTRSPAAKRSVLLSLKLRIMKKRARKYAVRQEYSAKLRVPQGLATTAAIYRAVHLQRLRSARGQSAVRALAHLLPGVVIGVGRLRGRALVVGDAAKVHADPRPGRAAAAHGIDEHVLFLDVG